ncbi:hypothetical protein MRX96_059283 [Rhipicephalus microplus]
MCKILSDGRRETTAAAFRDLQEFQNVQLNKELRSLRTKGSTPLYYWGWRGVVIYVFLIFRFTVKGVLTKASSTRRQMVRNIKVPEPNKKARMAVQKKYEEDLLTECGGEERTVAKAECDAVQNRLHKIEEEFALLKKSSDADIRENCKIMKKKLEELEALNRELQKSLTQKIFSTGNLDFGSSRVELGSSHVKLCNSHVELYDSQVELGNSQDEFGDANELGGSQGEAGPFSRSNCHWFKQR